MSNIRKPRFKIILGDLFRSTDMIDNETGESIPVWAFTAGMDGREADMGLVVSVTFPPGYVEIETPKGREAERRYAELVETVAARTDQRPKIPAKARPELG